MKDQPGEKYALSETAIHIWKNNDIDGENRMLIYITTNYKEHWFKSMIYRSDYIAQYRLSEIAEEAFYAAWQNFNERGKVGKLTFTEIKYTSYLKQVVHKTFIRLLQREMKEIEAGNEYSKRSADSNEEAVYEDAKVLIREKVQKTLSLLPADSASLMQWRYIQKMSYTAIAERMNILEKSCKQKLYRAKKEFLSYWRNESK